MSSQWEGEPTENSYFLSHIQEAWMEWAWQAPTSWGANWAARRGCQECKITTGALNHHKTMKNSFREFQEHYPFSEGIFSKVTQGWREEREDVVSNHRNNGSYRGMLRSCNNKKKEATIIEIMKAAGILSNSSL